MFSNNNSNNNSKKNTNNNNKLSKNDLENKLDNTMDRYNVVQLKIKFKNQAIIYFDGVNRPELVLELRQETASLEVEAKELMNKIEKLKTQSTQMLNKNTDKSLNLKSKWAFFKDKIGISNAELFSKNKNSVSGFVVQHLVANKQTELLKKLAQTNKFWNKEVSTILEPYKQARLATLEKYKTKETFDPNKFTYCRSSETLAKIKERMAIEPLTTRVARGIDPFYDETDRVWLLWGKNNNPSDAINNMNLTVQNILIDNKYLMIVYLNKFEDGSITKKNIEFIKENINLLHDEDKNKLLNTFPEIFAPENNSPAGPRGPM